MLLELSEKLLGMGASLRAGASSNILLDFIPVLVKHDQALQEFCVLVICPLTLVIGAGIRSKEA